MASIFSRIAAGEIPSYKVAEDDAHFAFLDINPMVEGHTLVIPKREVDYIYDLSDEEFAALQLFSKRVALAAKKALPCRRVANAVLGMEVPHAHIHILPINSEKDVDFRAPKKEIAPERMKEIAAAIAAAFE